MEVVQHYEGDTDHSAIVMKETNADNTQHTMVFHQECKIEPVQMACAFGKSPMQELHDLITHNVTPVQIQQAIVDHKK